MLPPSLEDQLIQYYCDKDGLTPKELVALSDQNELTKEQAGLIGEAAKDGVFDPKEFTKLEKSLGEKKSKEILGYFYQNPKALLERWQQWFSGQYKVDPEITVEVTSAKLKDDTVIQGVPVPKGAKVEFSDDGKLQKVSLADSAAVFMGDTFPAFSQIEFAADGALKKVKVAEAAMIHGVLLAKDEEHSFEAPPAPKPKAKPHRRAHRDSQPTDFPRMGPPPRAKLDNFLQDYERVERLKQLPYSTFNHDGKIIFVHPGDVTEI